MRVISLKLLCGIMETTFRPQRVRTAVLVARAGHRLGYYIIQQKNILGCSKVQ